MAAAAADRTAPPGVGGSSRRSLKQHGDLTAEDIRGALSHVDPSNRWDWFRMAMVVWMELGDAGFDLWNEWSKGAPDAYDERSARQQWRSARKVRNVGVGTLIHLARQHGWTLEGRERTPLSEAEVRDRDVQRQARAVEAAAAAEAAEGAAARVASEVWNNATPVQGSAHAYLQRKGIEGHGVRVGKWPQYDKTTGEIRKWIPGALLVPMKSQGGQLTSLQAIFGAAPAGWGGDKSYLRDGAKRAASHMIGEPGAGSPIVLCEGYATGASIHQATGWCVVVCFDANNLPAVAESLAGSHAGHAFVVAADNDCWKTAGAMKNPGVHYASEAARLLRARVVVPSFRSPDGQPTDFNDLHQREGVAEVARQLIASPHPQAANDAMPSAANDSDESGQRDERRRELQKWENAQLQKVVASALPPQLSEQQMVADCVWISDGSLVGRLSDPHQVLTFADFRNLTAASVSFHDTPGGKPKAVANAILWMQSDRRTTVSARTFHAGAAAICRDPDGRLSLNSWRPIVRDAPAVSPSVEPFLTHVAYLLGDQVECDAFLDWLAHLEQRPGELPHYGWLHIAAHTGTGRNWLASLLARVWRGYVAPNLDLPALLDSQFNGQLAGRLLAIVDEVQEAAGDNPYRHVNRLKSLVNAEFRDLNPKFGRQYREHNSCRWLVFSNHDNALPINDTDRRWRVVRHDMHPRKAADYASLYASLNDPAFIDAVGAYLRSRDITGFNPGARPPMNAAKRAAVDASKPMTTKYAEELVARWPTDVIINMDAARAMSEGDETKVSPAMRRALMEVGAVSIEGTIHVDGRSQRAWILRNKERWLKAAQTARSEVATEAMRARDGLSKHEHALEVIAAGRCCV